MQSFPPTIIVRHRSENLKKCSLRGLESRSGFLFYRYPLSQSLFLPNYLLLTLDAPPLTEADDGHGLIILDATWRYAMQMQEAFRHHPSHLYRSLPSHYRTAYPRRQTACLDPARGLASIEAIYLSYHILKRPVDGLLDNYYWKDAFLCMNQLLPLE